ncbi:hypothetical protein TWF281_007085 [Arthrobotrys megalospora]
MDLPNDKGFKMKFLKELLQRVLELRNVIIVMASGNESPNIDIRRIPQVYASDKNFMKRYSSRFVVVGGSDPVDGLNLYQKAPFMKVWAPATCRVAFDSMYFGNSPSGNPFKGNSHYKIRGGTSYAAPAVSGTIAMWLSAGVYNINNVVEGMYRLAYKRNGRGPPVLYNGITELQRY